MVTKFIRVNRMVLMGGELAFDPDRAQFITLVRAGALALYI
jgi:hypothetical protein